MHRLSKMTTQVILVAVLWHPLQAQEGASERMLIIRLKDGKTVSYPLDQVESIQFDDRGAGNLDIDSGRGKGSASLDAGSARSGGDQPITMRVLRSAGSLSGSTGGQNLFDGSPRTGWSSLPNARFPHEFVVELPQSTPIGAIEFDNSAREGTYPGAAAREVRVLASNVGPSGPFQVLVATALARGVNGQRFLVGASTVRWLQLLIYSNYGHPNYTELMDMRVYPPPAK